MKIILFTFLLLLACYTTGHADGGKSCLETAMTQSEMNGCANIELEDVDRELNRVCQSILLKYKNSPLFLQKLKNSQRTWIELREADFEMRYPHSDDAQFNYGSVYPLCANAFSTQLTITRIIFLKEWLVGYEEGEMCSGSLMKNDYL